ncbi:MAG: DUF4394 domain-containing protein [Blastocatellia bacterium]|nr:DUF4394 domain-containing protein [Blastocatellia bacterium]
MTTKRKFTTLTLIALAFAASLTFGLGSIRSAKANTTSAVTAKLFPSLAAQVPGLNIQYYAIDANNNLYVLSGTTFNRVNTISNINGDQIIGIDFRPATGQLYALSNNSRLYTINTANAAATLVSTVAPTGGVGTTSLFDFNPVVDALRIIGTNDQNFAIVKDANGVLNTVAQQTSVAYVAGDAFAGTNPNLTGGSYTNNVNGATTTLFYALDSNTDKVVTIADKTATGSSNTGGGRLQTVGTLYVNGLPMDFNSTADMDVVTFQAAGGLNVAIGLNGNSLFTLYLIQISQNLPVGTQQNLGANGVTVNFSTGNVVPIDVAASIPPGQ